MRLIQQIGRDVDTDELCETFKQHVELGVNLLRLVNSAALARSSKVATVRDAVVLLGRRHLRRWLHILLFAGADSEGLKSPLLLTAAKRGRLMELTAGESPRSDGGQEREGRAFLVGMLSLIDALFSRPLRELIEELELEDEINAALLENAGDLGTLLRLVQGLERGDFSAVAELSDELGVAPEQVSRDEIEATVWVHALGDSSEGNTAG
jgi:EAL and modified HD-GYP domain-containing signal transduction protein